MRSPVRIVLVVVAVPAVLLGLLVAAAALLPVGPATAVVRPVLAALHDAPPLPDPLPSPDQRSVVTDADGDLLAVLSGAEERAVIPLDRVPDHVVAAVVAIEDSRFFRHRGIDPRGIVRAAVANLRAGEIAEGASTITQQLVDLTVLAEGRSLDRKVDEAWLALQLEERATKSAILQRYLNEVYLGNGVYGIATAAGRYFRTPVPQLTVAQGALLAGMIAAPESYDPLTDPDAARARRDVVLHRMVETGLLADAEGRAAMAEPLQLDPAPPAPQAHPFLVDVVLEELLQLPELGPDRTARRAAVFRGGLQVATTIDLDAQAAAEAAIAATLPDPATDPQATVVSVEPVSGAVRVAAVGPDAYGACPQRPCTATQVNPAWPGLGGSGRQPGSAFKPVVVAAALAIDVDSGIQLPTPSGVPIPDCPTPDGPYRPDNYSGEDGGTIGMREALRRSSNTFHARLAGRIGVDTVRLVAEQLGFDPARLPEGCSIALGAGSVFGLEMAGAYATFLNDGIRCPTYVVERIARGGGVLVDHQPTCTRILQPDDADRVVDLLTAPIADGTATGADIGRPAIAKTGTTDDNLDAWLVGGVPQLATAVWIGFEEPRPLRDVQGVPAVTGGSLPADLWRRMMSQAVADLPVVALPDAPPAPPERPEPATPPDQAVPEVPDLPDPPAPGPGDPGAAPAPAPPPAPPPPPPPAPADPRPAEPPPDDRPEPADPPDAVDEPGPAGLPPPEVPPPGG